MSVQTSVQLWSDNLRLPCLTREETTTLLEGLSPPRQSIPFQSKHLPSLKRNVWFALRRTRDRTGYLCILPEKKCCVYVSGDAPSKRYPVPRVALLRIRVDPQFFEPGCPTVIEATLSARDRKLWIEDVGQWKGRVVASEPFSTRWSLAKQWLEHYCIADSASLGGLEIELAPWTRLIDVKPEGTWELQVDEPNKRRLRFSASAAPEPQPVSQPVPEPILQKPVESVESKGNPVAVASKIVAGGPDQWSLTTSDGVTLGRALIRSFTISSSLRTSKQDTVRLEVQWRPAFKKWEAIEITTRPASLEEYFNAHKVE